MATMRMMRARFAGRCWCGAAIAVGQDIGYDGKAHCVPCVQLRTASLEDLAAALEQAVAAGQVDRGALIIQRMTMHADRSAVAGSGGELMHRLQAATDAYWKSTKGHEMSSGDAAAFYRGTDHAE